MSRKVDIGELDFGLLGWALGFGIIFVAIDLNGINTSLEKIADKCEASEVQILSE